jgi:hypothetical protein
MKKIQSIVGIALCGIILGAACTASAEVSKRGYATVVRVQGLVSYTLGDNVWHPLVPGKYLPAGSSIRTGDNGVADVVLGQAVEFPQAGGVPDRISLASDSAVRGMVAYKPAVRQNAIRLTPNTFLTIDKLTTGDTGADTVSDTELDLKKGKIFASVKKLSGASQYMVKIPNGIAGVRGTEFSIGADGATAVFSTHGNDGLVLSVTLPGGVSQTFVLGTAQAYDPVTGRPTAVSPAVLQILSEVFPALKTAYIEVVNYDTDPTQHYVSPGGADPK